METKYYHTTSDSNFKKIKESMKLTSRYNQVYACKSIDDVMEFAKKNVESYKFKYGEIVILEFTTNSVFEESFDHNAKAHNYARAYKSYGEVKLESLNKVDIEFDWENHFKKSLVRCRFF